MAIDQDTAELYRWLATANSDNYTRATDTSRILLTALFPEFEPTHTLLTMTRTLNGTNPRPQLAPGSDQPKTRNPPTWHTWAM